MYFQTKNYNLIIESVKKLIVFNIKEEEHLTFKNNIIINLIT